ncbi:MAG: glycine--tRNA ligase [Candidatus Komeilibacteria bacterium]|nr:glycine--tRNA ligase [Candidatus Komeilibacteria bacterium]
MAENKDNKMEKLVSLAKRRGFIFQSSEIYGGLNAAYDYGPLGVLLKNNLKQLWWRKFVTERADMVGLDSAIIMHPKVWEASGHIQNFSDPLVDCKQCRRRWRADHLLAGDGAKPGYDKEKPLAEEVKCPTCGGELTTARQFNLMFETRMGPVTDEGVTVYLRPETAGGIFVNFKNVVDTMRQRVPFGIGQIGKAFRNEITTENFIFRTREFEQMEIEYFVHPDHWQESFAEWLQMMRDWCGWIGLPADKVQEAEISEKDRAFYSQRTIDFQFQYPFGQEELYGLAYRTDYDLQQHQKYSGQDLVYTDPITKEKYVPHVIEPSLGVDRSVLAVLLSAYTEIEGGRSTTTTAIKDSEVVLKLPYYLAPITVAVLPLSNKETLAPLASDVFNTLRTVFSTQYDATGSIGKRYRRQDEIGTPFCVTVDFESLEDKAITVRDRDTMAQERVAISEIVDYITGKLPRI